MCKLSIKIASGITAFFFAVIALSNTAQAIPVATVGSVDTYLGFCDGSNPSDANELACFNSFGIFPTSTAKVQGLDLNLQLVDGTTNTYAQALPAGFTGDYFLLNTGNLTPGPGGPTFYTYVFQNLANVGYAVVTLDLEAFELAIRNAGNVSHFTAISVSAVPLPAAAWMLLSALGGIFGFRKFGLSRRKAA